MLRAVSERKIKTRHHDLVRINKPTLNWKFPHDARTMVRKYLSVSKKLDIVAEACDTGNLYTTAQKYDVQPYQIRERRENEQELIKKDGNGNAYSVHYGTSILPYIPDSCTPVW